VQVSYKLDRGRELEERVAVEANGRGFQQCATEGKERDLRGGFGGKSHVTTQD